MRLRKIKMAGFKSFVEPTTILFPSEMVGIVGPNGCGKSNIVDAVRWVMGESSRHLRGATMDDVIFNGSSSRKPVGLASIELVFENSEGRAGGQYARYNEISIRRQVTRDGQSKYFLNATQCRRRDISDIFLGTGLGPRSYAIIEQGMISRLIEAKPEELRVYLEEAAGISKYKERRRETENRIRHARENLDRLNDLREEVTKQLNRLKRQASAAERYKSLKQQERRVKAEVLALRWQSLDCEEQERKQALKEQETQLEKATARLRDLESEIARERQALTLANEAFNEVQAQYYRLDGEVSRTEQSIQHLKENRTRHQDELQQTQQAYERNRQEITLEQTRLRQLEEDLGNLEPEMAGAQNEQHTLTERLNQREQALSDWQYQWEGLTQRLAGPSARAQGECTRIEYLESQLSQLEQREIRLQKELSDLSEQSLLADIEQFETKSCQAIAAVESAELELEMIQESIAERRQHNLELNQRLDEARTQQQNLRGRLVSLEALQEAALGKQQEAVIAWLSRHDLGTAPRLAEQLTVEPGWERALEAVMGPYLEAVCVSDVDSVVELLGGLEQGHLVVFDSDATANPAPLASAPLDGLETDSLLTKVQAPCPVAEVLAGVHVAETLEQAFAQRSALKAHESLVTRDGIWLGPHWFRVARDPDEHAGVLAREREIKSLSAEMGKVSQLIEALELKAVQGADALQQLEHDREQAQAQNHRALRANSELELNLSQRRQQLEQMIAQRARLQRELQEIQANSNADRSALTQAVLARDEARRVLDTLATERELLEREREELRDALDAARNQSRQGGEVLHQRALRLESMRSTRASIQQGLERMQDQLHQFEQQLETLQTKLEETLDPLQSQQQALEIVLSRRIEAERSLGAAREQVKTVEAGQGEREQQRSGVERELDALRSQQDRLRMAWQEVSVRSQTLKEQLSESGFELSALIDELESGAELNTWEQRAEEIQRKIDRLGPINLAAIEEYEEQNQRQQYLDSQHADLSEALDTLDSAIQKIDKETKHRFQETFDRVNNGLQAMFPRLFGGGQAHLTMTEENVLNAGISIMARPPGKKLSTIHLMSGGEKALTAVALVFAIFELNPAPFCMLDEVDAPLDEANVDRFGEVVKAMSEHVQFIFVTHNKVTMEYADQLIGVTMHEPGVSRMVAVDVDEAVQMATG
jgi:chromosome segregation protein